MQVYAKRSIQFVDVNVDLHLEVPSWMSLNEAHKVADELEEKESAIPLVLSATSPSTSAGST